MATIGLIGCAKRKRCEAATAHDLYDRSSLFCASRTYVKRCCDAWYVLSAKYGLLRPERVIEPYEEALKGKKSGQRREWADCVWRELQSKLNPGDLVIVLAGKDYFEFLVARIEAHGCDVVIRMKGLKQGQRQKWLKEQNTSRSCE